MRRHWSDAITSRWRTLALAAAVAAGLAAGDARAQSAERYRCQGTCFQASDAWKAQHCPARFPTDPAKVYATPPGCLASRFAPDFEACMNRCGDAYPNRLWEAWRKKCERTVAVAACFD
jgi:hypothetical protein